MKEVYAISEIFTANGYEGMRISKIIFEKFLYII